MAIKLLTESIRQLKKLCRNNQKGKKNKPRRKNKKITIKSLKWVKNNPKIENPYSFIGFVSYNDYIKSDLWKEIRIIVLRRDGFKCRVCSGKKKIQVHHKNYELETLTGKNIEGLITLCEEHHKLLEFNEDGTRKGLSKSNPELEIMLDEVENIWVDVNCDFCGKINTIAKPDKDVFVCSCQF